MSEWFRRAWYWLNRRRFEQALREEMAAHRDQMAEPRRFGNTLRLRDEARDVWRLGWLDGLGRDTRVAARVLLNYDAADLTLGVSPAYFMQTLPRAVPLANIWLALSKSAVFGVLIALIACYHGMRVLPNTESLGRRTTSSVVISITIVILVDALFAVLFKGVGFRA